MRSRRPCLRFVLVAAFAGAGFPLTTLPGDLPTPPEVQGLSWCPGGKSCLQWIALPNVTSYSVYRGTAATLPALLTGEFDSCLVRTVTTNTTGATLPQLPGATLTWYLVRARNAGGEGPAGYASTGPEIHDSSGACPVYCTAANDCPASQSCNLVRHECEGACGDADHTRCNGGCCDATRHCVRGDTGSACGGDGGNCFNCTTACDPGAGCDSAYRTCTCYSGADCAAASCGSRNSCLYGQGCCQGAGTPCTVSWQCCTLYCNGTCTCIPNGYGCNFNSSLCCSGRCDWYTNRCY